MKTPTELPTYGDATDPLPDIAPVSLDGTRGEPSVRINVTYPTEGGTAPKAIEVVWENCIPGETEINAILGTFGRLAAVPR